MRINDAILGLVLLGLGVAIVLISGTFPESRTTSFGPGFFPSLLGYLMAGGAVILIVGGIRELEPRSFVQLEDWWRRPRTLVDVLAVPAAGFAYVLVVERLGFALTGFLIVAALLWLYRVRRALVLPVAAAIALSLVYVFSVLLRVPLPRGPLEAVLPGL